MLHCILWRRWAKRWLVELNGWRKIASKQQKYKRYEKRERNNLITCNLMRCMLMCSLIDMSQLKKYYERCFLFTGLKQERERMTKNWAKKGRKSDDSYDGITSKSM